MRRICWYSLVVVVLVIIGLWGFPFYITSFTQKKAVLKGGHATDEAIKALSPDLLEFELLPHENSDYSKPTVAGLKSISRLVNLKYARFTFNNDISTDSQFAITALKALKDAKGLEKLYLTGGLFTPDVLSHISELKSIKYLIIQDTRVSDTRASDWNLEGLEGHPNLETLEVICTTISEKGYDNISRLPKLRNFMYGDTGMTPQIEETLKNRNPDLVIQHNTGW